MESNPIKKIEPSNPLEREMLFSNTLIEARQRLPYIKKANGVVGVIGQKHIVKELERLFNLKVSHDAVINWEKGVSFPEEERLVYISQVYGIGLAELTRVWNISKSARTDFKKGMRDWRKLKASSKEK